MNRCLIFLLLYTNTCFSQTVKDSADNNSHSVFYGNRLSTHPFGILTSRTNHNFQTAPAKKISLAINMSSGNVWLPYVKAYQPLNEEDKIVMRSYLWHQRESRFDPTNKPNKSIELHADGVIRLYQVNLNIPLPEKHDLNIYTRAFSLDKGKVPFSLLTSDQFIEWFHSNISGGEDPFARKVYGLDNILIYYKDENGKLLEINKGGLTLSGIDLSYNYYPVLKGLRKKKIYTNLGLQLGGNVSNFNPSLDFGFNSSIVKKN